MVRTILVGLALCGVACGGKFVDGAGDAGPDSPGPSETGTDSPPPPPSDAGPDAPIPQDSSAPWSPICPVDQPAIGSACSLPSGMDIEGTLCEYGKLQFDPGCDTVLTCNEGHWANAESESSCSPDGPNSAQCPATYADTMDDGGACSDDNLHCAYPEGVCVCSMGFGGPIEIDGGSTWSCNPGAGCPVPRPRLGAACTASNQSCQYLSCQFAETCQDGYWQGEFEGCATPGHSP
jgi:hypothetical protein